MTENEFCNRVKNEVRIKLADENLESVNLVDRLLQNDVVNTFLNIQLKDNMVGASINLTKAYEKKATVDECLQAVRKVVSEMRYSDIGKTTMDIVNRPFDEIKDRLYIKACDKNENWHFLSGKPHTDIGVYAAAYYLNIENGADSYKGIVIDDHLMNWWGTNREELHEEALAAMNKNNPPVLRSLMSTIMGVMGQSEENLLGQKGVGVEPEDMLILTRENMTNGSSCIFDGDVMEQAGEAIGTNYFILPSSVHEVILIPDDGRIDYSYLKQMVSEANMDRNIID